MSRRTETFTDRDVERLLEATDVETTPPADLLGRLVADIPTGLEAMASESTAEASIAESSTSDSMAADSNDESSVDAPTHTSAAILGESFRDEKGDTVGIPEWRGESRRVWALAATLVVVVGAFVIWPAVDRRMATDSAPTEPGLRAIGGMFDEEFAEQTLDASVAEESDSVGAAVAADTDDDVGSRDGLLARALEVRQDVLGGAAEPLAADESSRRRQDVGVATAPSPGEGSTTPPSPPAPSVAFSPPPSPAAPPSLPSARLIPKAKKVPVPTASSPAPAPAPIALDLRRRQLEGRTQHADRSIEAESPRIESMRREAAAFQGELKQLDEEGTRRRSFEDNITVTDEHIEPPQPTPSSLTMMPSSSSPAAQAPPNAAPFDTTYFDSSRTNPFVDSEDDALSTFGLDVDTGSWGVVKRFMHDGFLPPPNAVRIEEILNAFDYGDAPPSDGSDFAVHVEAAPAPYATNERTVLLRVGIQGRAIDVADRAPATLVFVVDVSGSMDRGDRLELVKQSLDLLLDQMRPDDRVGLVAYGSTARVLLEPTADIERARATLASLRPGGSTNAEHGLMLGYQLAFEHRREGAIHRVILCSDGVANTGATGAAMILDRVRGFASQGVELTTVGFGMGHYNDVLMERLANDGNGRYAYVDALPEARRLFVEQLTGTLQTIAAEARAQVVFDPEHVERWRLLGYENRDIADHRFRDDTVDAGEIGAGHAVTVLYELKLAEQRPSRRAELATVQLRWASIASKTMVETATSIRGRDVARTFGATSTAFQQAAHIAEFAEILKRSYWARGSDPKAVAAALQQVAAKRPGDAELAEMAALAVRAASRIQVPAADGD
ncbi:MAG: von Willebrand factor type A domain-containing protein [Acidobacteriota bacterium]